LIVAVGKVSGEGERSQRSANEKKRGTKGGLKIFFSDYGEPDPTNAREKERGNPNGTERTSTSSDSSEITFPRNKGRGKDTERSIKKHETRALLHKHSSRWCS